MILSLFNTFLLAIIKNECAVRQEAVFVTRNEKECILTDTINCAQDGIRGNIMGYSRSKFTWRWGATLTQVRVFVKYRYKHELSCIS